jgi:hypothetical protein
VDDLVTGLGTPIVNKVVVDLVGVVEPAIGSFTISPGFVSQGNSVTLTASNVISIGGTISEVDFYRESNDSAGFQISEDTLVGSGAQNGTTWTLDESTDDLAAGVYTYYALAVDDGGESSVASSAVLGAGIAGVQNLAAGSVVSFRLTPYGASSSSGAWYIYDGGKNTNDLVMNASEIVLGTPTVGTLLASMPAVMTGDSLTLTANHVTEGGGVGTIAGVNVYLESNETAGLQSAEDTLVGAGVQNGTTWMIDVSTIGLAAGVYTYYAVASDGRGVSSAASSTLLTVSAPPPPPAVVVARQLFYNNSVLDDNDPAATVADDSAIASGLTALLPGEDSASGHVSGYSKGINGVMIDVNNLADPDGLTLDDFEFRVGSSGDPAAWTLAPAPAGLSVRAEAGVDGSARISLVWSDGAIVGTWLGVTLKANARTGLLAEDVFYFGSLAGDANGDGQVGFGDLVTVAEGYGSAGGGGVAGGDFDGDGAVGFSDLVNVAQNYEASLALPEFGLVLPLRKLAVVDWGKSGGAVRPVRRHGVSNNAQRA